MDPSQDKPQESQTTQQTQSSNDYSENMNKNQTPAFNNTEYWNPKTAEASQQVSEPVNPPKPPSPEPQPELPVSDSSPTPEAITPPPPETPTSWNTPPTPPKPPNSSSNALMIVMVVLVIVLLGGTGLFWFQNYQLKNQVKNKVVNIEASPSPEAIPDPTADWKTHTDSQLGISIRFPSTWSVSKTQDIEGVSTFWLTSNSPNKTASTVKNLEIIVGSDLVYSTSGSSGIFANTTSCGEPNEKPFSVKIENEVYTTSINGNACVGTGENAKFERYSFHFEKQGKLPHITGTYFTYSELEEIKQILSTLEFTTATPSPSASPVSAGTCERGYKAFIASDYSLCYPETLKLTSGDVNSNAVVFDNTNETFKVTKNFQGGWGGSTCLFIDKTTVSGYPSKRLSWKTEKTDGTCDTTFISFAEMINEGVFKFPYPYALELTSKKVPYNDNSKFITIENSFKVGK